MKIALVTEVFIGKDAPGELRRVLRDARRGGAELAVLPELALDPWFPATREVRAADAEPPEGPRHRLLASLAREERIGIVGGAVVIEPDSGKRYSTALIFDAHGQLAGLYRKAHLPEEEGFWEASHYSPGGDPPEVVDAFDVPIGVQLCSDVHRPEGSHLLGALGAEVIFAPRCTPEETYERWKLVLRSNAVTSCCYVVSTNRPRPESGVGIGGPSLAIGPGGEVLVETAERSSFVSIDRDAVRRARAEYPGYLEIRSELYARGWGAVRDPARGEDKRPGTGLHGRPPASRRRG